MFFLSFALAASMNFISVSTPIFFVIFSMTDCSFSSSSIVVYDMSGIVHVILGVRRIYSNRSLVKYILKCYLVVLLAVDDVTLIPTSLSWSMSDKTLRFVLQLRISFAFASNVFLQIIAKRVMRHLINPKTKHMKVAQKLLRNGETPRSLSFA